MCENWGHGYSLREGCDDLMGLWQKRAVSTSMLRYEEWSPRRALSSLSTTRRSPRTSSFSFPVSPCFSRSYSSSFSSWSKCTRWVNAVLTVLEDEEPVSPPLEAALLTCGNSTDTSVGGNVIGSDVDGWGCTARNWRSREISVCEG
jgi:hypothetical protein